MGTIVAPFSKGDKGTNVSQDTPIRDKNDLGVLRISRNILNTSADQSEKKDNAVSYKTRKSLLKKKKTPFKRNAKYKSKLNSVFISVITSKIKEMLCESKRLYADFKQSEPKILRRAECNIINKKPKTLVAAKKTQTNYNSYKKLHCSTKNNKKYLPLKSSPEATDKLQSNSKNVVVEAGIHNKNNEIEITSSNKTKTSSHTHQNSVLLKTSDKDKDFTGNLERNPTRKKDNECSKDISESLKNLKDLNNFEKITKDTSLPNHQPVNSLKSSTDDEHSRSKHQSTSNLISAEWTKHYSQHSIDKLHGATKTDNLKTSAGRNYILQDSQKSSIPVKEVNSSTKIKSAASHKNTAYCSENMQTKSLKTAGAVQKLNTEDSKIPHRSMLYKTERVNREHCANEIVLKEIVHKDKTSETGQKLTPNLILGKNTQKPKTVKSKDHKVHDDKSKLQDEPTEERSKKGILQKNNTLPTLSLSEKVKLFEDSKIRAQEAIPYKSKKKCYIRDEKNGNFSKEPLLSEKQKTLCDVSENKIKDFSSSTTIDEGIKPTGTVKHISNENMVSSIKKEDSKSDFKEKPTSAPDILLTKCRNNISKTKAIKTNQTHSCNNTSSVKTDSLPPNVTVSLSSKTKQTAKMSELLENTAQQDEKITAQNLTSEDNHTVGKSDKATTELKQDATTSLNYTHNNQDTKNAKIVNITDSDMIVGYSPLTNAVAEDVKYAVQSLMPKESSKEDKSDKSNTVIVDLKQDAISPMDGVHCAQDTNCLKITQTDDLDKNVGHESLIVIEEDKKEMVQSLTSTDSERESQNDIFLKQATTNPVKPICSAQDNTNNKIMKTDHLEFKKETVASTTSKESQTESKAKPVTSEIKQDSKNFVCSINSVQGNTDTRIAQLIHLDETITQNQKTAKRSLNSSTEDSKLKQSIKENIDNKQNQTGKSKLFVRKLSYKEEIMKQKLTQRLQSKEEEQKPGPVEDYGVKVSNNRLQDEDVAENHKEVFIQNENSLRLSSSKKKISLRFAQKIAQMPRELSLNEEKYKKDTASSKDPQINDQQRNSYVKKGEKHYLNISNSKDHSMKSSSVSVKEAIAETKKCVEMVTRARDTVSSKESENKNSMPATLTVIPQANTICLPLTTQNSFSNPHTQRTTLGKEILDTMKTECLQKEVPHHDHFNYEKAAKMKDTIAQDKLNTSTVLTKNYDMQNCAEKTQDNASICLLRKGVFNTEEVLKQLSSSEQSQLFADLRKIALFNTGLLFQDGKLSAMENNQFINSIKVFLYNEAQKNMYDLLSSPIKGKQIYFNGNKPENKKSQVAGEKISNKSKIQFNSETLNNHKKQEKSTKLLTESESLFSGEETKIKIQERPKSLISGETLTPNLIPRGDKKTNKVAHIETIGVQDKDKRHQNKASALFLKRGASNLNVFAPKRFTREQMQLFEDLRKLALFNTGLLLNDGKLMCMEDNIKMFLYNEEQRKIYDLLSSPVKNKQPIEGSEIVKSTSEFNLDQYDMDNKGNTYKKLFPASDSSLSNKGHIIRKEHNKHKSSESLNVASNKPSLLLNDTFDKKKKLIPTSDSSASIRGQVIIEEKNKQKSNELVNVASNKPSLPLNDSLDKKTKIIPPSNYSLSNREDIIREENNKQKSNELLNVAPNKSTLQMNDTLDKKNKLIPASDSSLTVRGEVIKEDNNQQKSNELLNVASNKPSLPMNDTLDKRMKVFPASDSSLSNTGEVIRKENNQQKSNELLNVASNKPSLPLNDTIDEKKIFPASDSSLRNRGEIIKEEEDKHKGTELLNVASKKSALTDTLAKNIKAKNLAINNVEECKADSIQKLSSKVDHALLYKESSSMKVSLDTKEGIKSTMVLPLSEWGNKDSTKKQIAVSDKNVTGNSIKVETSSSQNTVTSSGSDGLGSQLSNNQFSCSKKKGDSEQEKPEKFGILDGQIIYKESSALGKSHPDKNQDDLLQGVEKYIETEISQKGFKNRGVKKKERKESSLDMDPVKMKSDPNINSSDTIFQGSTAISSNEDVKQDFIFEKPVSILQSKSNDVSEKSELEASRNINGDNTQIKQGKQEMRLEKPNEINSETISAVSSVTETKGQKNSIKKMDQQEQIKTGGKSQVPISEPVKVSDKTKQQVVDLIHDSCSNYNAFPQQHYIKNLLQEKSPSHSDKTVEQPRDQKNSQEHSKELWYDALDHSLGLSQLKGSKKQRIITGSVKENNRKQLPIKKIAVKSVHLNRPLYVIYKTKHYDTIYALCKCKIDKKKLSGTVDETPTADKALNVIASSDTQLFRKNDNKLERNTRLEEETHKPDVSTGFTSNQVNVKSVPPVTTSLVNYHENIRKKLGIIKFKDVTNRPQEKNISFREKEQGQKIIDTRRSHNLGTIIPRYNGQFSQPLINNFTDIEQNRAYPQSIKYVDGNNNIPLKDECQHCWYNQNMVSFMDELSMINRRYLGKPTSSSNWTYSYPLPIDLQQEHFERYASQPRCNYIKRDMQFPEVELSGLSDHVWKFFEKSSNYFKNNFNSYTNEGRANVAKATLGTVGIIILWCIFRPKVKKDDTISAEKP